MSNQKSIIYITDCLPEHAQKIQNELDVIVYTRLDANTWDTNSLMEILADSRLILTIINKMTPEAIVEMTICDIFCKKMLITTETFIHYESLHYMVPTDFRLYGSIYSNYDIFKNWFLEYKRTIPKVVD